jgi:ABC-type nitrate/sulfonate/bicarbonate transport system ATPase subunit
MQSSASLTIWIAMIGCGACSSQVPTVAAPAAKQLASGVSGHIVWTRTRVTAVCVTHDVDEAILLADRVVMMSNGPNAKVGKVMHVDLPRPRTRQALLEHPDYYRYRQELLDFLEGAEHEEQARAEAA